MSQRPALGTSRGWARVCGVILAIIAVMAAGMFAIYAFLMLTGPRM